MLAMVLDEARRPLRAAELPVPEPGPGEVLVRVHACGVCRTDLHIVDGDLTRPKLPLIPGHEIVGTVHAIGTGVERLAVGQRVGVPWLGVHVRSLRLLPRGAREPLRRRALHRLRSRRRLRGVHRRRCPVLLPAAGRVFRCACGAAALRRSHRLSLARHGGRRAAARHLRLRRGRPHHRPGGCVAGARGLCLHPSRRRRGVSASRCELGAMWAGDSTDAAARAPRRRAHLRASGRPRADGAPRDGARAGRSCARAST